MEELLQLSRHIEPFSDQNFHHMSISIRQNSPQQRKNNQNQRDAIRSSAFWLLAVLDESVLMELDTDSYSHDVRVSKARSDGIHMQGTAATQTPPATPSSQLTLSKKSSA